MRVAVPFRPLVDAFPDYNSTLRRTTFHDQNTLVMWRDSIRASSARMLRAAPCRASSHPMTDAPLRVGLVIVGDEILSGKREDKHLAQVIRLLAARGLGLAWAAYVGDDRAELTALFKRTFASSDIVLICGGIGSTPDDHTRQAAAAALGTTCVLHREAEELITLRCADMAREGRGSADMTHPENRQRLKMGEFPAGAIIIPNPFNRIPGFGVRNHWFMPGFPVMAWPMIEWVLDTHYTAHFHRHRHGERSLLVFETAESALVPLMEAIEREFAGIKAFSLPSIGDGRDGRPARRHVELGVKGDAGELDSAFQLMRQGVERIGAEFEVVTASPASPPSIT
jgi:molybdopterin-biosynthesis enzyme MoeA-like protein